MTPTLHTDGKGALAAALVAAQAEAGRVAKSATNEFDRYTYATLDDFLDVAQEVLAKHKLAVMLRNTIVEALDDRTTSGGKVEHAVRVRVALELMHETGESLAFVCAGEGQDRGDKAIYKAITSARKYAMAGLLNLATTDDPEADQTVGTDSPPPAKTCPQHPETRQGLARMIFEMAGRNVAKARTLAKEYTGNESMVSVADEDVGMYYEQVRAAYETWWNSTKP
jgi:hypothetical protein